MFIPRDWEWDAVRWARAIRSHQTVQNRVEVWSDGQRQTSAAPFLKGAVTDQRVVVGQRRSLNLTVPPTWQRWFDLPGFLELRPYSGVMIGRKLVEVPQGRFPLLAPERRWPADEVTFTAVDYWQRVVADDFAGKKRMSPGGVITEQAATLMIEAGLGRPEITATSSYSADPVLLDKARTEAIGLLLKPISAEAWIDREGNAKIINAVGIGTATSSTDRNAEVSMLKPDWAKVYNQVAVTSSAQDVDFGEARVSITDRFHPASPQRLGITRTLNYSSPLLFTYEQGLQAAATILARVSGLAESYTYECVPDPLRDAGDTIQGITLGQIESVTHPLTADGRQTITTVNTQGADPE